MSLHRVTGFACKLKYPYIAKRGVYVVLAGCLFINVLFTLDQPSYLLNNGIPTAVIIPNISIGLALLLLLLNGLLADVCFTRYRMI